MYIYIYVYIYIYIYHRVMDDIHDSQVLVSSSCSNVHHVFHSSFLLP